MEKISEILSLSHFDSASRQENKQRKFYGAIRKLPKAESDIPPDLESSDWQEEDRRQGDERRLLEIERNKRFEYRNKKDRRKSKSISITA